MKKGILIFAAVFFLIYCSNSKILDEKSGEQELREVLEKIGDAKTYSETATRLGHDMTIWRDAPDDWYNWEVMHLVYDSSPNGTPFRAAVMKTDCHLLDSFTATIDGEDRLKIRCKKPPDLEWAADVLSRKITPRNERSKRLGK